MADPLTPVPLTRDQLEGLRSQIATNRGAVYQKLRSLGYRYADLAYGVVSQAYFSGRVAQGFANDRAAQQGHPLSLKENNTIGIELAGEYITALEELVRGGHSGQEISGETAYLFHKLVFGKHGLSDQTWTLTAARDLLSSNEFERIWKGLLDRSGPAAAAVSVRLFTEMLAITDANIINPLGSIAVYQEGSSWIREITKVSAGVGVNDFRNPLQDWLTVVGKGVAFYPMSFESYDGVTGLLSLHNPYETASVYAMQRAVIGTVADQIAETDIPFLSALSSTSQLDARNALVAKYTDYLGKHQSEIRYNIGRDGNIADSSSAIALGQIASTFGSTLGRLIGGSSLVIGTASGVILSAIALTAGQQLFNSVGNVVVGYSPNGNVGGNAWGTRSVWKDFGNNLQSLGTNAAIGSVSGYLAAEFSQSIGLSGFGGRLFSSVTSNVLQYELTQLVAQSGIVGSLLDKAALTTFGDALTSGIAGFIGVELASLIVTPHTVAEATLASIGSAVGTIVAATNSSLFGLIGLPGGPVGIAIGAFVGFILGDLIGSLFGHHKPRIPTASAETVLEIPLAKYAIGTEVSADGGDLQLADAMAKVARDTLNGLIAQITGNSTPSFVSNTSSPTQTYGIAGSQLYVKFGGVQTDVKTADQAVNKGVLWALPQTKVIGGDIILKRAISLAHVTTVTELLGELQIAKDYATYLSSRPIIDAAISRSWNSLSSADQGFYADNKAFMTRAISASQLPLTGADVDYYNANKPQVDRIIGSISVSSFAAGWIVTLARAAELGLGDFNKSDFYGGLRGFLDSMGISKQGAPVNYEDIDFAWQNGPTSISVRADASRPAAFGEGTFSLLPQSSADGRSVTVASLAAIGYAGVMPSNNGPEDNFTDWRTQPGATLSTNGGNDIIVGSDAKDNMYANGGSVWFDGRAGNDYMVGSTGRDVLLGGAGDDYIVGGSGDSYLSGGSGNDTIINWRGNIVMVGGSGSDTVTGGEGNDTIVADQHGTGEYDQYDGGAGQNTVSFERFTTGIGVDMWVGRDANAQTRANGDSWKNMSGVTGSNFDDAVYGDQQNNVLRGLGGNDRLYGTSGDDILEGGASADVLDGGVGNDTASYAGSSAGVYVNLATGTTIGGDATGDVLTSIENLFGSALGDELAGDGGVNVISADAGDDWIDATAGADSYQGGDGFDTVDYSLTGFAAGSVTDAGGYTSTAYAVSVTLGVNGGSATYRAADGSYATQTLASVEQIIGTSSNEYFSSSGSNINVTWDGAGGQDWIYGGTGSDTYVMGLDYWQTTVFDDKSASNTLLLKSGLTFDSLWAGTWGGNLQIGIRGGSALTDIRGDWDTAGNDVLKTIDMAGAGHVDMTQINGVVGGTDSNDTISGSAVTSNFILGYNGDDVINAASNVYSQKGSVVVGGLGNDSISTSVGDDQYLYERGDGQDTVFDNGGRNTIVFGSTVGANDVIYQVAGSDLWIGVKDLNDETLTASQVTDRIFVSNGGVIRRDLDSDKETRFTSFSVEAGGATTDLTKANIAWTYANYHGGSGGGPIQPIVLDLTNDGLELSPVGQSDIVTRDGVGNILRTSWVGPTNGILAVDRNGDGRIDNTDDISFVKDKAGAKTDLEGLGGWDTNNDGVLDAKDANFSKLTVWVDANQDGRAQKKEVRSLAEAGVVSIALKGKPTGFDDSDTLESFVRNTTTFTRSDGTIGTGYDVALARQTLAGDPAFMVGSEIDLHSSAVFGQLKNDPLATAKASGMPKDKTTVAATSALADADFSDAGGVLTAAAAARWSYVLDPAKIKAHKDFLATGMSGADDLGAIRSISANDPNILSNRGARDPKTRLQVVVVDFDKNGADLVDAKKSRTVLDLNHAGDVSQIGWVKGSDGILVYDRNGDGTVDTRTEISFLGDAPNARTAFEGLGGLDTNKNGALDVSDASFGKLLVWRDQNGNGMSDTGELQSLSQAGIKSLQLAGAKISPDRGVGSGNDTLGVSKVVFADGSERAAYDIALGFADSKEGIATAKSAATAGQSPLVASAPSTSNTSPNQPSSVQAPTAKVGTNAVATIGLSRSLDGPSGLIVEFGGAAASDKEWWRDASVVGQGFASLAQGFSSNDQSLGTNQPFTATPGVTDAATAQRVMLLRQNMASLQPAAGGSAAIWGHDAATDGSMLAGSALPPLAGAARVAVPA